MHLIRPAAKAPEPRVTTIEGRKVLIVERKPPLPPTLGALIGALRVSFAREVRPSGTRSACLTDQDHRLTVFREGRHVGHDGIARDLRLLMCADCESVCVRDVSLDRLARAPLGRLPLRRRNHVLGWYTGARPNQRIYR